MLNVQLLIVAILLFGAENINGKPPTVPNSAIKGRLLTPEEGCGLTKVKQNKIVGGTFAKEGAWPWIVAIAYRAHRGYEFECGGSLITSRHVLTAGHCITSKLAFVRLGAHSRFGSGNGPDRDMYVIDFERHPDYVSMTGTDIAVLYLKHDVDFTDRIRPICLPTVEPIRSQNFIGSNPFVAGWGQTSTEGEQSIILKQLQVPILENKLCQKLYKDEELDSDFSEKVVCAGNLSGGNGICHGDSGGPLMLPVHQNGMFPFYQIGVVSFSMDCGDPNSPDGYASTQYHADWIQKMIQKNIN